MYLGTTKLDESRVPYLTAAADRLEIIAMKSAISRYDDGSNQIKVMNEELLTGPNEELDIFAKDMSIPRIIDTVTYPVTTAGVSDPMNQVVFDLLSNATEIT